MNLSAVRLDIFGPFQILLILLDLLGGLVLGQPP